MKVNKFFLLSAITALCMTACSADDEMVNNTQAPVNPDNLNIEVSDAGTMTDEPTRATYSGLTTTFENGDAIGVYAVNASGTVMTANAKFTKSGDSWTSPTSVVFNPEWSYYAYYPWVASPYSPDFAASGVDNQFATFIADASNKFHQTNQSTKANYQASDLMIAQGSPSGTNKVIFSMYHKKGLARLSGGGMAFTTFSGNVPYTNGDYKYYLMKPSTATTVGGKSLTAASGKYVDCVYDMATIASSATDISMYNTAGTLQGSRSTANCYMIHNAGTYKLPLVYGNAITSGSTKTSAYQAPSGSGTYRMANFKNHANQNITDPWIKNNNKGGGVKISVDEAELMWQDANGLIDAVGVSGDWLVFRVPSAASTKAGNAVVAAKDDGTIVWSWHIWVTTETYASTTTVTTSANTYKVTNVNLGWIPTGGGGKLDYCPYYQWGRKDAFVPSNGSNDTDHTVYDINGNTIEGIDKVELFEGDNGDPVLGTPGYYYCISRPTEFYYDSYGDYCRWYSEEIANLWDSDCNAWWDRSQTNKTVKTVYDPCPAGFCVPTQNLYWYYFGEPANDWPGGSYSTYTNAVWDGTNKGITVLSSIWYPASGVRWGDSDAGVLSGVGGRGGCWSASPGREGGGSYLDFYSSYWGCRSSRRAYGQCVRPVSE